MKFSIIIPVYNEEDTLRKKCSFLQWLKTELAAELIIIDGKSDDNTFDVAKTLTKNIYQCDKSRSNQLNIGAEYATGKILIFLHVDTYLNKKAVNGILNLTDKFKWGFFNIKLDSEELKYKILSYCINLRSKLFKYGTGDQVLIVNKRVFHEHSGYKNINLMEDVEISKRLKLRSNPEIILGKAVTSVRRWQKYGFFRTIFLMRFLRILYCFGVNTKKLEEIYK